MTSVEQLFARFMRRADIGPTPPRCNTERVPRSLDARDLARLLEALLFALGAEPGVVPERFRFFLRGELERRYPSGEVPSHVTEILESFERGLTTRPGGWYR